MHSRGCVCDVAVTSWARVRDAIVDVRSQMFDGTILAQTVATTTRKQWSSKKHDVIAAPKDARGEIVTRPRSGLVGPRAACMKHIDHNELFAKQRVIAHGG